MTQTAAALEVASRLLARPTQPPPARAASQKPKAASVSSPGRTIFWFSALIALSVGTAYFKDELLVFWTDFHRLPQEAAKPTIVAENPTTIAPPPPVPKEEPATPAAPVETTPASPAPDVFAWLLQHKSRWPEEITLLRPADFPAVVHGKIAGAVKVPTGMDVQVVDITPPTVAVVYNGGGARLPIEATNLRDLAMIEMNRGDAPTPSAPKEPLPQPLAERPQADSSVAERPARKAGPFVHPGALHTKADFERMAHKVKAKEQPWFENWQMLESSPHGLHAPIRPVEQVIRGGAGNNYTGAQKDAATLYQCALRYRIAGDKAQADKAVELLNQWAATMKKGVGGDSNFALGAGIVGYEFACGAEMMRGYPGWKHSDFLACQEMMKLFLGSNRDFLRRRNGTGGTHYRLNWDTCNMTSMLAIGVFLDDEATFNEALDYFFDGVGNGCVERAVGYVFPNGLGQTEEMGRDQPHNLTGLDWMAKFCQIAWNQGVDLYGYDNNRLLRGWEYVAKYNLGYDDVPFVPHRTYDLKYTEGEISPGGRGLVPMFELIYNHYANRKGIAAPYVKEAAEKTRPEGGPGGHPSSYDRFGYGTLTYTLDPLKQDAPPSGLRGFWSDGKITLSWWGSAHAERYEIRRATQKGGPYASIGTAGPKDTTFVDPNVTNGATYYYVIAAANSGSWEGESSAELEVAQKLVTRYDFEGNLNDTVGKKHAVASANLTFPAGAENGKAIELDGKKDYLTLPTGVANFQDITIAAWVFWDGGADFQRVFDFGGDVTKSMFLTPKAAEVMRFEISTSRGTDGTGRLEAPALKPHRWTHVAVTLSGHTGALYVDGVAVDHASMVVAPLFTQNHCYIGKSQWPDPLFKGKVDDFRIYNYALSAEAVSDLFRRRN